MKKSSIITLVLVSSFITISCQNSQHKKTNKDRLYLRSDSSGSYSKMHSNGGFYPYYMFHSFGSWNAHSGYHRSGFSSNSIHSSSNIYTRTSKSGVTRGGFGSSSFHTGS